MKTSAEYYFEAYQQRKYIGFSDPYKGKFADKLNTAIVACVNDAMKEQEKRLNEQFEFYLKQYHKMVIKAIQAVFNKTPINLEVNYK